MVHLNRNHAIGKAGKTDPAYLLPSVRRRATRAIIRPGYQLRFQT